MHVIVVGCGRVGSELALGLDNDGHSVAIIDKDRRAFRRLPEQWGGRTVIGFGFDRDHLEEAGAKEAGGLAAVTSGDNSNVLAARIARETYQIPNVVARIYDPRRAVIYERLGIPTVATVTWTTEQVRRRLIPDTNATEWADPTGSVMMVERGLPETLAGRTLASLMQGDDVRLIFLTRGSETRLATPDLVGQEGDRLIFALRTGADDKLEQKLGVGA
ncbi:MAG: potassium channel family protein [Acidimicrobiales bacterium]